jgi:pimeloyl-ACP methyl ester carboxylesterase
MDRNGVVARWTRRLSVALTAVAALSACAPPPPDAGFSIPPEQADQLRPGDVIRARAWTFSQDPLTRAPVPGVHAVQVLYRSTNALGKTDAVSGTVLLPDAPWRGPGLRPLVSYAVGTHGLGDDCAPSRLFAQGIDYESGIVLNLLAQGWAVAVTDMEGLGTPGVHTYNVGTSAGRAVLDMARAALRLPEANLPSETPVGIMGYSQGGGSAAWAAQLAPSYAPELHLVGVAAAGVPADPAAVARADDGGVWVGLVLLTSLGFDAAYPELHLDSYLNDRGRSLVATAKELCIESIAGFSTLAEVAGTHTSDYVGAVNPLDVPAWQARLAENRLGREAPTVPVLLQHGLFDTTVPFAQAQELRSEWCAEGAAVTWRVLPFAEHIIGYVQTWVPAISFLADRFAGEPVTGNCANPLPFGW